MRRIGSNGSECLQDIRLGSCTLGDFHFQHLGLCVMYGCLQPRELWFIDLIMYLYAVGVAKLEFCLLEGLAPHFRGAGGKFLQLYHTWQ